MPSYLEDQKILSQPHNLPLAVSRDRCTGKTYIVTGANVGLGLEAARHLVDAHAAKVILAVRNLQTGEAAKADIESTTGITGVVEVWELDLANYDSVKGFAAKAEKLERIDAIIQNAGVASADKDATGRPLSVKVNVISTFMLSMLLLPKMRSNAAKFGYNPVISTITSETGLEMGELWKAIAEDPIGIMDADKNLGMRAYPASKMLDILAVRQIGKLLPISQGGVVFNVVNPGVCMTTLSRNAPQGFKDELKELWEKCGRTPEVGSRPLLSGGMAGKESHGTYMSDCKIAEDEIPSWIDDTAIKQAWDSIAKEIEKIEPGVVAKALK